MYLVPLKFHGTLNLNVMIFEVRGYANFLIAAMWNDEYSAALVGWKSLLFIRVDQLAVEGTPYIAVIGPIHPAKIYSRPTCDEGHHYQCCSILDILLFSLRILINLGAQFQRSYKVVWDDVCISFLSVHGRLCPRTFIWCQTRRQTHLAEYVLLQFAF